MATDADPTTMIRAFLDALHEPGDTYEIRAPHCRARPNSDFKATASGYFNDHDAAAAAIAKLDAGALAPGIYVTINPTMPELLARANNRLAYKATTTTTDAEIIKRRWLVIDVDPVRPANISASDAELRSAEAVAARVVAELEWGEPMQVMSGNGAHLYYRVDIEVGDQELVKRTLEALAGRFDSDVAKIDRTMHNASRIVKVAGTHARKGDEIPDRPHRQSTLISRGDGLVINREALEAVAGDLPRAPARARPVTDWSGNREKLDQTPEGIQTYLERHGVTVKSVKPTREGHALSLERCIVDPSIESTGATDISVLVRPDGSLAYCNLHNRGQGMTWADVRRTLEGDAPEWNGGSRAPTPEELGVDLSELMVGGRLIRTPSRRFPDDLLHPPGLMGDIVAFNLETAHRRQPLLALCGAITLMATLTGRKIRDELGNRTNLYCVGVGLSGAGKDHARKVNKRILHDCGLGELEGNEELSSDAALTTAIAENPVSLFQFDEFGRFLRTTKDARNAPYLFALISAFMKLYSSADCVWKGKGYADRKQARTVDQPCAILHGTTVPSHLYESLTMENLSDGFVGRLLIFETRDVPERRLGGIDEVPGRILEQARWWGDYRPCDGNLASEHPAPKLVRATDSANRIFDELAARVDSELKSAAGSPERHGAASCWARAEEKARRLALVYAASADMQDPSVDEDAARWACGIATWTTEYLLDIADDWIGGSDYEDRQLEIVRFVKDRGGCVAMTDISRRFRKIPGKARTMLLRDMQESGLLEIEELTPSGRGRPKTLVRVG